MEQVDWASLSKKKRRELKREMEREEGKKKEKSTKIIKWSIISLLILLLIVGGWWLVRELTKPLPGQAVNDLGRQHVPKEQWEKFSYNSNPPTSGPHDPTWIKAGIYNEEQGDGHLVHSLEHGYIIISHNCEIKSQISNLKSQKERTESAEVDQNCIGFVEKLKERVNKDSFKLILVPRPLLDTNLALTAWTKIDKFNTNDAIPERVENFISAYRNHGPEKTIE